MNKNTKILLGVGALAVVGYFVWKNNQPTKSFSNFTMDECGCHTSYNPNTKEYECRNGQHANKSKGACKGVLVKE